VCVCECVCEREREREREKRKWHVIGTIIKFNVMHSPCNNRIAYT